MIRLSFFTALLTSISSAVQLQLQSLNGHTFAQVKSDRMPSCHTTMDRAKIPSGKFYEVVNGS